MSPPYPNMRRLMSMLRQFDETHRKQMPDAHWYLMALSVEPAHQRMGHGSALVRHGIQRSNDDGRPVYLETETAPVSASTSHSGLSSATV